MPPFNLMIEVDKISTSVGFTGTSSGMSDVQLLTVESLVAYLYERHVLIARHGMCIGGDEEFHGVASRYAGMVIYGYPGVTRQGKIFHRAAVVCHRTLQEKFFLDRNRDIVDASTVMLAAPKQVEEQFQGSGTWATIRYARKQKKPLLIVWPSGKFNLEF